MAIDQNKIKYDFFTFDGAISKAEFARSFLILFVIGFAISALAYTLILPAIIWDVLAVIRLIILIAMFSITIRRLRDLGHSGWLSLLLLIPVLNLLLIIYLLVADRKTIL